ncbi:hypothetical protein DFS34DRAFT_682822 [Phlyctochytrium arcticum]|nr:hypothetical protein DFS34DRAFT_682822 [Phlyctochytrium arcticum]
MESICLNECIMGWFMENLESVSGESCYHDVAFLLAPSEIRICLGGALHPASLGLLRQVRRRVCCPPYQRRHEWYPLQNSRELWRSQAFGGLSVFESVRLSYRGHWSISSYKGNHFKVEATFLAQGGRIMDTIGHEMGVLSELMTHGTTNEYTGTIQLWSKGGEYSQFSLYDFFHETGDIVSRDRWYGWRETNLWFLFFHGLWLDNGQNINFLTKFWDLYSLHYPKIYNPSTQEWGRAGNINIGEVIFFSAAVGRNLTTMAASRFTTGWKPLIYFAAVAQYPVLLTYEP